MCIRDRTDTKLGVGGRRFGTTARKVDGGYVVNGRKFFVSLAGAAPYYATPAIRLGDEPWIERTLYLQVPRDAPGVSFPGDWEPRGLRATGSRAMPALWLSFAAILALIAVAFLQSVPKESGGPINPVYELAEGQRYKQG